MILYYAKITLCIILSAAIVILLWIDWDKLMLDSYSWKSIYRWSIAAVIVLAIGIFISGYLAKEYLVCSLSFFTCVIGVSYFVLDKYYLLPERYFEYKKDEWKNMVYPHSYHLEATFLSNSNCRRLLASDECRRFLIERLQIEKSYSYAPPGYCLMGVLAYESFRQRGDNTIAAILSKPHGYRVVTALLFNEITVNTSINYRRGLWREGSQMLAEFNLKPQYEFQFGLLNREDFRQYYHYCVEHIQNLTISELELLLFFHSKIPLKVSKKDFSAVVQRLAELKPQYREELFQVLQFKDRIETLLPEAKEYDEVSLNISYVYEEYLIPLVHMCGYLLSEKPANSSLSLEVNLDKKELYEFAEYGNEEVEKTTQVYEYSYVLKRYTYRNKVIKENELVKKGTNTVYSTLFTIHLQDNGKVIDSLKQYNRLGDKFFDKDKQEYTVDSEKYRVSDTWLFTIPEKYVYDDSFLTQDK